VLGWRSVSAAPLNLCSTVYCMAHPRPIWSSAPQVVLPALQADVEAVPPPADVQEALQSGAEAAQQRQGRQVSQRQDSDAVQHSGSIGQQSPGGGELSHQSSDAARQYGSMVQQQQQQQLAYGGPGRRYLTCCVRLSPEKEPERFVAAIEALAGLCSSAAAGAAAGDGLCNGSGDSGGDEADGGSCGSGTHSPAGARQPAADGLLNGIQPAGAAPHSDGHAAAEAAEAGDPVPNNVASENRLQRLGVTPLLCGSATTEYAQELKARLRAASPDSVIQERFLSPTKLVKVGDHAPCARLPDKNSTDVLAVRQIWPSLGARQAAWQLCEKISTWERLVTCERRVLQVYAATKLNVHPCRYVNEYPASFDHGSLVDSPHWRLLPVVMPAPAFGNSLTLSPSWGLVLPF